MKKALLVLFTMILIASAGLQETKASHWVAGNITYRYLGPNQYLLTCALYRDCSGISAPTSISIDYRSVICGITQTITLQRLPGSGQMVSNSSCIPPTTCTGANANGIEEHIYQGTITLPQACPDWAFTFVQCCRNPSLNLVGSSGQSFLIQTKMNNLDFPTNSSPFFNFNPYRAFCVNNTFYFDQGATDIDGDNLRFRLVGAQAGTAAAQTNLAYVAPYNPNCFMAVSPICDIVLDTLTGLIIFTPSLTGKWVINIIVEQYDPVTGKLIGTVKRDMQIQVFPNCNILVPAYAAPVISSGIQAACGDKQFVVTLSTNIQCATCMPDGSDFRFTSPNSLPLPIVSAMPLNCVNGFTNQILVTVYFPLTNGVHYLYTKVGFDNNTLLSECGSAMKEFDTALVVINDPKVLQMTTAALSCNAQSVSLTFNDDIICNTVTGNGSDFILIDQSGIVYPITSVTGVGCTPSNTHTTTLNVNFSGSISGASTLYLIAQNGIDNNTIANRCGNFVGVGDTMAILSVSGVIAVNLGGDQIVCSNDPMPVIDAGAINAGSNFTWTYNGVPVGGNTQTITSVGPGTYVCLVSLGPNCFGIDSMNVIIIPAPIVGLGNDYDLCSSDPLPMLDAGNPGAVSYSWFFNGSPVGSTQTLQSVGAGTYTVIVDNGSQCTGRDTIELFVTNNPVISMADQTICDGTFASLDAGFSNANSYSWTLNGNPIPDITQTIQAGTSGVYSVTATIGPGCTGSGSMVLTVIPVPKVDLGQDKTICISDPLPLLDASAANANNYQWFLNGSPAGTGPTLQATTAGTYIVVFDNGGLCSGTDTIEVFIVPILPIDLGGNQAICEDDAEVLDAGSYPGATYQWFFNGNVIPGITSQTFTATTPGTYVVKVTSVNGCIGGDTMVLAVDRYPIAPFVKCLFKDGQYTYVWEPIPGASGYQISLDGGITWVDPSTGFTGLQHMVANAANNFFVAAVGNGLCKQGPMSPPVACELIIPNIITINSDGKNEGFHIINLDQYPNSKLEIFNRWGSKVYEHGQYEHFNNWNGTHYKTKERLADGVYFYVLKLMDGTVHKGTITIVH